MQPVQTGERVGFASLPELKVMFDRYIECKAAEAEKTPVNATRQEILKACRLAAISEPGLFALTVPTEAERRSPGWPLPSTMPLNTANGNHLCHTYTSIVEQTAGILRDIFGDDNVVEHHSNLEPERKHSARNSPRRTDAPVVVTTNVQFFESLFAANPVAAASCITLSIAWFSMKLN